MSENAYWLAKTNGGWTVQDRCQIFAVHVTHRAALAHLDALAQSNSTEALDAQAHILPDMPQSDSFFRRFG